MANHDWAKIRNEYVSTGISYRKLAEKHGVSFNTLKDRATRENWGDLRADIHHKITTKTPQKIAEKLADREADFAINFAEINHALSRRVLDLAEEVNSPQMLKQLTGALKDIKDVHTSLPDKAKDDGMLPAILECLIDEERRTEPDEREAVAVPSRGG